MKSLSTCELGGQPKCTELISFGGFGMFGMSYTKKKEYCYEDNT